MNHEALQEKARDNLLLHFSKQRVDDLLVIERGEGPYVFDTEGRRYIDSLSSLFCAQLGYSYGREMAEAAATQLTTLAFHTTWATAHPTAIELAEQVCARAPAEDYRAFFTSGGSESVEAAWKLAREHYLALGQPQRTKAIARKTAYHGVTLGALALHRAAGLFRRLRTGSDRRHPRLQHQRVPRAGRCGSRRRSGTGCWPRSRTPCSRPGRRPWP